MNPALQLLAAGACLLFASACLGKLDSWRSWNGSLSQVIPVPAAARLLAVLIPATEGVTVVLLIAEPKAGLVCSAGALTVFGVAVLALARRHADRHCNCFGALAPSRIGAGLGIRNLALAATIWSALYVALDEPVSALSIGHVLIVVVLGLLVQLASEGWRLRAIATPREPTGGTAG